MDLYWKLVYDDCLIGFSIGYERAKIAYVGGLILWETPSSPGSVVIWCILPLPEMISPVEARATGMLVEDHLGTQELYAVVGGDGFIFGNELKLKNSVLYLYSKTLEVLAFYVGIRF
ncbi:hypothetical protein V6N11_043483 [Hibiscus sabdariffa]|uniref:Uncharacterized protein n=1 Tax=Hibiscus sabdariffa TaxID=183260 RepID=A0ABR2RCE0_9ROSI